MTLTAAALRCAHLDNPLGVAPDRVRFSWLLNGAGMQAGYQIQVFQNDKGSLFTGKLYWDSGRIDSAESADVAYEGPPLRRGGRYEWRVRVRDADGTVSGWSDHAWFEVELAPSDWRACWIGLGPSRESFDPPSESGHPDAVASSLRPAPYLRRSFVVAVPVASARLYVTALGLYEARLNGARVGDAYLTPGWTDYHQRVLYQTYDVTGLVRAGDNVLGALLGDGWYAGFVGFDAKRAGAHYGTAPELLAQLVITHDDGSVSYVVSDGEWEGRYGAVRHADLLMGTRTDLRLEPHGWDAEGAARSGAPASSGWRRAECRVLDGRPIVADPGPPIRVTDSLRPVQIFTDKSGRQLVDFGQNLTGWVLISASGAAGTEVRVRHGEVLDGEGGLYTDNLRTARQADEYVLGDSPAMLEPRFTIHGFRYAEISGYPGDLDSSDVVARVAHSDIAPAGEFRSSERWLDRLIRTIDWSQRGNFISVPTDCPQRDERLGWLGDAQIFARTAAYNRDVAAFFGKWLDDVADAQHPSGAYPDIAPRLFLPWAGAPAWGDAGVIVPWTMWKMYGDTGVLSRHFGAMTAWMSLLERSNPDWLRSRDLGNSYNDWLAPGRDDTPPELLATAYWAHDAALMAEIADAIGRPDEAAEYRAMEAKVRSAFGSAFVSGDGEVASGTQTAYVLALHMGLVPDGLAASAASRLVQAIRATGWHLTTGFAGVGYLLPVLSAAGHTDVAYRILTQDTLPSWRYMLNHGATTIWERWDGWTEERGFQSAWMNSFNHYSLGSVGEWLYRFVLGIDQEPGTAGFGRLLLRPHPGGSLGWACGSYRSVRGLIRAGWERSAGTFTYRVELPGNVTADVRLPTADASQVRDGAGRPPLSAGSFPGDPGTAEAVYHVGPGTHEFSGPRAEVSRRAG